MNKVEILENGNVKITIPMSFRNCAGRKRIVTQELNSNFNEPIITGTLEKDIGIEQLKRAMPLMWDDQKKMFGME